MDECRREPTPRRRSHLSRPCEQEEEEDEEVVKHEGEEREVGEEEQEEVEESPNNQEDEDGEEVEDVAEGAAYQPTEVAEAAAEAVEAQIDGSIEESMKRIRDMWDVPDSPMGESSSINKGLTSHAPPTPTSSVQEEPALPLDGGVGSQMIDPMTATGRRWDIG